MRPGHFLAWHEGRPVERRYWRLPGSVDGEAGRPAPGLPLTELLQDAVSSHLASDVPVGTFLSGGVDSGAVVALAHRASGDGMLTTLTVTFDEAGFSEATAAREAAKRFHTDHREVPVTRADFLRDLPRFFDAMDQPTNDGLNTYFVSKAAKQAGLTVVLSGLGGDEVFWGYSHHRSLRAQTAMLERCPGGLRKVVGRLGAASGGARGRENWMRMAFFEDGGSSRQLYLLKRGFFPPQQVRALLGLDRRELADVVAAYFDGVCADDGRPGAEGFNHLEHQRYLHDQLLRDADVFGMAHSIEIRVPLLDHRVVEHAAGVSAARKIARRFNKPLLVEASGDAGVRRAASLKKRGFTFPMQRWMTQSAADLESAAGADGNLDRGVVRSLWSEFRVGRLHWSRAWALAVLGVSAERRAEWEEGTERPDASIAPAPSLNEA